MEDGNYKLGTTKGKPQHYYSRNQFAMNNVPDIQLVLGEIARLSNLGGQGYDYCTCVQKYDTRKCKVVGILRNTK